MTNDPDRLRGRLFGRPHRARGRAGRARRPRLSRLRVPGRAHDRARAAGEKLRDPDAGFDPLLDARMEAVLRPCAEQRHPHHHQHGRRQPARRARRPQQRSRVARAWPAFAIAAVSGDDVLDDGAPGRLRAARAARRPSLRSEHSIVSANAYLGAAPIVQALRGGADVVITGRVGDPALFLAPLVHEFGWAMDDWDRLGQGTVVGHLLECAGQITGGYFADPGYKDVPDLARLGFPIAEVSEDGSAVITKVEGSGGRISVATCKEQLLYELLDPASYLQPDVDGGFLAPCALTELGPDRVAVAGGTGRQRPDTLKVSVGYLDSYRRRGTDLLCRARRSGAGATRARDRAERLKLTGVRTTETRFELIGVERGAQGGTARLDGRARRDPHPRGRAAPTAWKRPSASATRWRRFTPTARPAAGAPGSQARRSSPSFPRSSRRTAGAAESATRWPDMQLRELAHARTGDKGDTSQISVIAYEPGDYAVLRRTCHGGAGAGAFRRPCVRGRGYALRAARPRGAELRDGDRARGRRHALSLARRAR